MTVTLTDLVADTTVVAVEPQYPSLHLYALAMVYVTPVRALNETFVVAC